MLHAPTSIRGDLRAHLAVGPSGGACGGVDVRIAGARDESQRAPLSPACCWLAT
jgi:hypothetical protein